MRRLNLNYLLILIPVALWLSWSGAKPLLVFAVTALTILPLSKVVGTATETLGYFLGPTLGGLLNASMGNAPELIIGVFALKNGLIEVLKASLTGSILGNLLLTLGLAIFAGGMRYPKQSFNVQAARLSNSMMFLAVAGLMVPALFHFTSRTTEHEISLQIAAILLVVYGLSLVFTLVTHRKLFEIAQPAELNVAKTYSWKVALGYLAAATIALAFMSEVLTDALEPATRSLGINEVFAGVILLASVSNISSVMNAVVFAEEPDGPGCEQRDRGGHADCTPGGPRPGICQPFHAHVHGPALQPARTGCPHDRHLHHQEHHGRWRIGLAGRGGADRGLRDAGHRVLLHRVVRRAARCLADRTAPDRWISHACGWSPSRSQAAFK